MNKNVQALTEVPKILKLFFDDLEEFKAFLQLVIDNAYKVDELMAKMLTPMTTVQAEAIKTELNNVNSMMSKKMGQALESKGDFLTSLLAAKMLGVLANECEDRPPAISPKELLMLHRTGAYDKLMMGTA